MSGDAALVELLRLLKDRDYAFTALTPATHERVLKRRCEHPNLRDIFGWNYTFSREDIDPDLLDCLLRCDMVENISERLRSRVRVASLGDDLFLHSSFPTTPVDAVFFGPDTYRFTRFISDSFARLQCAPQWVVDMGAGSGAGAIFAARQVGTARVTAVDVNANALRFAQVNAEAAGLSLETVLSSAMPVGADLIVANPPYIMDPQRRSYRDGGDLFGGQVALEWVEQAQGALAPGGTMLLYTGASVVNGRAPLVEAMKESCSCGGAEFHFEEIDPDVFGEELDQPAYAEVERIAVICATIRKT